MEQNPPFISRSSFRKLCIGARPPPTTMNGQSMDLLRKYFMQLEIDPRDVPRYIHAFFENFTGHINTDAVYAAFAAPVDASPPPPTPPNIASEPPPPSPPTGPAVIEDDSDSEKEIIDMTVGDSPVNEHGLPGGEAVIYVYYDTTERRYQHVLLRGGDE